MFRRTAAVHTKRTRAASCNSQIYMKITDNKTTPWCAAATSSFTIARYMPDRVSMVLAGSGVSHSGWSVADPICSVPKGQPVLADKLHTWLEHIWGFFRGSPLTTVSVV